MEFLSKISINENKDKYFTWSFNFFFYVSQKKKEINLYMEWHMYREKKMHGLRLKFGKKKKKIFF